MQRKIYVASSWRNEHQPHVVKLLRELGHEVYDFRHPPNGSGGFSWDEIDANWEQWSTEQYMEALRHPIAEKGYKSDFDGMEWADTCVMVLPCGRSANTEAGWMKGAGKEVWVYSPVKQEPELMYKIYDGIISDEEGLREQFKMKYHPAHIAKIRPGAPVVYRRMIDNVMSEPFHTTIIEGPIKLGDAMYCSLEGNFGLVDINDVEIIQPA